MLGKSAWKEEKLVNTLVAGCLSRSGVTMDACFIRDMITAVSI